MNEISFQGRNIHIRRAQNILYKIDTSFPAICPWKVNRFLGNDGAVIKCPISQEKLDILRDCTVPDYISDYKYAAKVLEGVKQFKTANCKEYAELSYLIAKANDIKNCYCANLYDKISNKTSKLKDYGYSVLLIMPKPLNKPKFVHKYYYTGVKMSDSIIPDKNTIVVDPVFGIVDYWKNAILKYAQTPLREITSAKDIRVCLRQPLLNNEKEVDKLRKKYPILDFNCKSDKIKRCFSFSKGMRQLKNFKKEYNRKNMHSNYDAEDINSKILNAIKSYFTN